MSYVYLGITLLTLTPIFVVRLDFITQYVFCTFKKLP